MDINKENIESFFVELVDNDFRITPVIEDNLVRWLHPISCFDSTLFIIFRKHN